MNDKKLVNKCIQKCNEILNEDPNFIPIISIKNQLEFVSKYDPHDEKQKEKLYDINIGIITIREIGSSDEEFTN